MAALGGFLAGLRVLDLSRHFPGPLATLLLADMGADVLKVEPPGGEEMRLIGPRGPSGRSVYFDAVNAGKRTVELDIRAPEGRDAVLALAADADVLIDSFRPGVMDRRGLGYPALAEANPGLVTLSLNGFGATGPLRDRAGHDANYLALSGVLAGTGSEAAPQFFDPPVADCTGALMAAIAILGALHGRTRSGRGCEIDLSLFDAVMPLMTMHLAGLGHDGTVPERGAGIVGGGAAFYQVYRTADGGFVTLGAVEPKFWAAFCRAAGREDWIARQSEPLPQAALRRDVAGLFAATTLDEAVARFEPADCCFAPVLRLDQAVASPQMQARGLVRAGPGGLLQALFPAHVDGTAPAPRPPLAESEPAWRSRAAAE